MLGRTQDHRRQVLSTVAFKLGGWLVKVIKIKSIFHTMNKFNIDVTRKCLIAECWYPAQSKGAVQEAMQRGTDRSSSDVPGVLNDISTNDSVGWGHCAMGMDWADRVCWAANIG